MGLFYVRYSFHTIDNVQQELGSSSPRVGLWVCISKCPSDIADPVISLVLQGVQTVFWSEGLPLFEFLNYRALAVYGSSCHLRRVMIMKKFLLIYRVKTLSLPGHFCKVLKGLVHCEQRQLTSLYLGSESD